MSSVVNDDRTQPWAQWEILDVTFNSTANADTIIAHSLAPPTSEHVNYIPIRKGQASDVYHDPSQTRKAWGHGFIILRSTVASAKVTLLLTVTHTQRALTF